MGALVVSTGVFTPGVQIHSYDGDVFAAGTDAFVNPWNRNFIPPWALQAGGISGELKRRTGREPWEELAGYGLLQLGDAVTTGTGTWEGARTLIHVAGLNLLWRATPASIIRSTRQAILTAWTAEARSVMLPLIGAGHGGIPPHTARELIMT